MNSKICNNCKKTYDSSLSKCPHCGFEEIQLSQNNFNIRNPFLELRNNEIKNENNKFLNSSEQNNISNEVKMSSVSSSTNSTNNSFINLAIQPNNGVQDSSNNLNIQNNVINNVNSTIQPNNGVQDSLNTPNIQSNMVNSVGNNMQNNSEIVDESNDEIRPKAFEPYNDNKKYAVSGIDFNSFFNPTEEKKNQNKMMNDNNDTLNNPVEANFNIIDQGLSSNNIKTQGSVLVLEGNELKEKKEEKKKNNNKKGKKNINYLKYDFMFLTFLVTFVLIFICLSSFSLIVLVRGIINVILLFLGYSYADSKKELASYIGIVVSISLIFSITYKNYVDVFAGVIILIHSVYYLIKKQ